MLGFVFCTLAFSIQLPNWPLKYRFKGTWNIPYWNIKQPFYVSVDRNKGNECVAENSLNGYAHSIHCLKKYTVSRQVYTNITEKGNKFVKSDYCVKIYITEEKAEDDTIVEYLPTNNDEWKYKGEYIVLGKNASKWTKNLGINGWYYDFYADAETFDPIRLFQHGKSIKGSHPTDYILDFEEFGPTYDDAEFYIPPNCQILGNSSYGPTHNNIIKPTTVYSKTSNFNKDISLPKQTFSQKRNSASNDDDYKYGPDAQPYCENVTEIKGNIKLPEEFTWRDHAGVLPIVRDQASCGSCWAQAAGEAASSQFSLKTSKNISVSVQQIVDCSWGEGINNACDGGEGWEGYHLLKENNILLATEEEIPYLGIGGYCPTKVQNPIGTIAKCQQFTPTLHDKNHELLKKAVYKYGPLMVSIKAGVAEFVQLTPENKWFESKEYCDAENWKKQNVDHGVLLTGWAKNPKDNKTYLEIMNSWSTSWGENGFGYISEEYDCGIDSMALLPTVNLF